MKIIIGVYFVVQLLILSSLMTLQIQITSHIIMIVLSCVLYMVTALKNPGYHEGEKITSYSISDEINSHQVEKVIDQKVIKEADQQEQGNDKSLPKEAQEDVKDKIQSKLSDEKIDSELKTDSVIKKNDDKLQKKVIKSKFPNFTLANQQKLSELKTSQIDFYINKSTKQTHRFCRICKAFQPYRVRHCHECQKCILTFDHHCPWMNNCIGQRNRSLFWCFLVAQFCQFLLILGNVIQKALESEDNAKIYFFASSILLMTLVAVGLLGFHTYLMLKNFTTWQFVRWDKINYLSLYVNKKQSPFSYGFVSNISDYLNPGRTPKQWTINPQFLKKNKQLEQKQNIVKIGKQSSNQKPKLKTKVQPKAQTQRAILSRNQTKEPSIQ